MMVREGREQEDIQDILKDMLGQLVDIQDPIKMLLDKEGGYTVEAKDFTGITYSSFRLGNESKRYAYTITRRCLD